MVHRKKLAVFLGDFFWSSIPYDGLELFTLLEAALDDRVDLVMFKDDLRLNKKFQGYEKFFFESKCFHLPALRTVVSWTEFEKISDDYSLIVSSTHIAPKTRYPDRLRANARCELAAWDIGGSDILTNATRFASRYYVKGPLWAKWLTLLGVSSDKIWTTGTPHYDGYRALFKNMSKVELCNKYALDSKKRIILVAPSNPMCHLEQYKQNLTFIEKLLSIGAQLLVKTHPLDYVFYEREFQYSGVYRRPAGSKPQYESLKELFPEIVVLNSEDHFLAMTAADLLFNIAGSHIAWETVFTDVKCVSSNYRDKKYYGTVSYLPAEINFPDELVNVHIESIDEAFNRTHTLDTTRLAQYITQPTISAAQNICNIICDEFRS